MAFAAPMLPASAAAQADAGLSLYLAEPARPGRLEDCEAVANLPEPAAWRRVDGPLRLRWQGGETWLNPGWLNPGASQPLGELREHCFRLDLDGRTLARGASVSRHSARGLNFPVLLITEGRHGDAPEAVLKQSLIGEPAGLAPWLPALSRRFPTSTELHPQP